VLDLAALAVGLTDQDGAVLAAPLATWNNGYVHGAGRPLGHIRIVAVYVRCQGQLMATSAHLF
jgi:hypothetical protein